jgi:NADPH-dependent glutamate synthase beta subunit-like oxidoreductase
LGLPRHHAPFVTRHAPGRRSGLATVRPARRRTVRTILTFGRSATKIQDASRNQPARLRALIVGAGHNGLVCACYLARAGLDVFVLEQAPEPGGGSRTDETVPGYRFDTHSVAHNMINMTTIPADLRLG